MTPSPTIAEAPTTAAATRSSRRLDLVLGIVLGIVLGLGIVSAFVFLGSEGSIDAPRIKGVDTGKPAAQAKVAPTAAGTPKRRSGNPEAKLEL